MTQSPLFKYVVFHRQGWLTVATVLLLVLLFSGSPSASLAGNDGGDNGDQVSGRTFFTADSSSNVVTAGDQAKSLAEENSPTALTFPDIQAKGELPDGMPVVAAVLLFSGLTLFVFGRRWAA